MRIATFLSDTLLASVELALPYARVHPTARIDELAALLASWPDGVLVFDPCRVDANGLSCLEQILRKNRQVAAMAYTAVTPSASRTLMRVAKHGVIDFLLCSVNDAPWQIRAAIEMNRANTAVHAVLDLLSRRLERLPTALSDSIREMVVAAKRMSGSGDLATRANMSRRTMDRWLAKCDLPSAHRLQVAARLAHTFDRFAGSGDTLRTIAKDLGWSSTRHLRQHSRRVTTLPPVQLRGGLSLTQFLSELTHYLTRDTGARAIPLIDIGPNAVGEATPLTDQRTQAKREA